MGGYPKSRHVNTDDADTIDLFRQQPQRHTRRARDTQIGHHDGIVLFRIGHLMNRITDVFEQLAGHQGFGVERHIADRALGPVEMRGERQAVDAAGRPGQHGGGSAHAQAHTQRAKCRTHALRLVMRTGGIIFCILVEDVRLTGQLGGLEHFILAGMASVSSRVD